MKLIAFVLVVTAGLYSIFLYGNQATTISHGPGVAAVYKLVVERFNGNGGGTAFLIRHPHSKEIVAISNKHVCALGDEDTVWKLQKIASEHRAQIIKVSKKVDLCMLKVTYVKGPFEKLHTVKLADKGPERGDEISTTGFALLKTMMTYYGTFLGYMKLPYDAEDPLMSHQVTGEASYPIIPGNSGSPVFNTEGEVIGVSYAYTRDGTSLFVPLKALHYFLVNSEG